MAFAILILVNQIPETHFVAFSDDLPSLPDLPLCSMTNDRFPFPPLPPYSGDFFSPPLVVKIWTLWCAVVLQSWLQASNVFLPHFSQLFTSQLQLLTDGATCSLSQPSRISLSLGSLSTPGGVESLYVFNSSRVERSVLSNKHSLCNEGFPQLGKAADKTIF